MLWRLRMRSAEITRKTKETDISVILDFEGTGKAETATGIPFFDHMLTAMAKHGGFDLRIRADGDLAVDSHHTIEDTAIVLGEAIRKAVGEGRGIRRFSHAMVPMDEALATVAMDCSGRGYLVYQGCFSHKTVGTIEQEVFEHFFQSLCSRAGLNVHILFHGKNDHHQCEALFKAFGIALGEAVFISEGKTDIPSTKGVL
jgi:imidazoleglycerol phosphate dehydratase HisB